MGIRFSSTSMSDSAVVVLCLALAGVGCRTTPPVPAEAPRAGVSALQDDFWKRLQAVCGKAFKGSMTEGNASDSTLRRAALIMHVRECAPAEIRIPFHAG